jgi:hypothetical protein
VRLRRSFAAVLAVALVAGCSGGGPRLTRANFQEKADKECKSLQKASDAFARAQAPGAKGEDVAKYLHAGANELRDLVTHVEELRPPESMQADLDKLLDLLDRYAGGLDTLADRAGPEQTYQDVLHESPKTVERLNVIATKASHQVALLGLVACLLPS